MWSAWVGGYVLGLPEWLDVYRICLHKWVCSLLEAGWVGVYGVCLGGWVCMGSA